MDSQNNNQQNNNPLLAKEPILTPNSPSTTSQKTPKKVGPIIATFIVIVIVIAAILYFMGSNSNKQAPMPTINSALATQQADVSQASTSVQPITNTADDVQSLQDDLNNSTAGIDSQNF